MTALWGYICRAFEETEWHEEPGETERKHLA
jgi:hypothetical protein